MSNKMITIFVKKKNVWVSVSAAGHFQLEAQVHDKFPQSSCIINSTFFHFLFECDPSNVFKKMKNGGNSEKKKKSVINNHISVKKKKVGTN